MTPMQMIDEVTQGNGQLRGLTGSGRPGLHTLLGGTGEEQSAASLTMTGGSGQVSATSRVAQAYRDTRLAAIAAGTASIPGQPGGGSGGRGGGRGDSNIPTRPQ